MGSSPTHRTNIVLWREYMIYTAAKICNGKLFVCRGEPKFEGIRNCCVGQSLEKYMDLDVVGRISETINTIESTTFCPPIHIDELYISTVYQSFTLEADSDNDAIGKVFRKIAGYTT